ncbi:MAG: TauD/TfdA dioxygenase family protein, partial [Myxococcota bacterium]
MSRGWVAQVSDVALESGVSDADWARIKEAWSSHFCLVFAGQGGLSIDAHVALLARFGPIIEERLPGDKHSYVTNAEGHGVDEMNDGYIWGELTPHMDFTYTPYPADVISLFAEEVPAGGTSTYFYNNAAPLGQMPAALRSELAGREIRCVHDLALMPPDARPYLDPAATEGELVQAQDWPLVREHPGREGLEVLACSLQQTAEVLGCADPGESR